MEQYYFEDGLVVRESVASDVKRLELRQSDIDEVWASHHHSPKEALRLSLGVSFKCYTIEDNGKPIAMFGISVQSILSDKATIWLLAAPELKTRAYRFIRHSKRFISMMLDFYPYLYNYCDVRNKQSLDWLRRCGAVIGEPEKYGVEGKDFCHFHFSRRN